MSRFDIPKQTIHAPWWDESETVTIKKLTHREQGEINQRIFGKTKVNVAKKDELSLEMGKSFEIQELILLAHIDSWTFANGNGEIVPVNSDTVGNLPQQDVDYILQEIDAQTETWEKQFPSRSRDRSENG